MNGTVEQIAAIIQLLPMHHIQLTGDHAVKVGELFGLEIKPYSQRQNLRDPKGYRGSELLGFSALGLLEGIADHLGVEYLQFNGRGSQHREICSKVLAYLEAEPKGD